tara:strand:- start:483 stop:863 length:381 start_codon:yes stop_codon:yes gene_type:complete
MKKYLLIFLCICGFTTIYAQRPGGGPETMIAREKQAVLEKITDLSEDQQLLLDGIYDEFAVSLKELFENRTPGSREGMREKFRALRTEKDDLIKDVLKEEQYTIYESIASQRRERRGSPPPNKMEE